MGTVYRVRDVSTGREIALKRLGAPGDAAPKRGARLLFEREFHTLAHLAHPRIIEVYDYGVDALGPFYTMELLDGDCARDLGRVPWRDVCVLLRDVASALALLHSRRYVYRDLTTRNIYVQGDGRAKLLDFGAMAPMGVSKTLVGTPPATPPEVVHAQPLDGRADLFALGATAYLMLTGRHAYPARSFIVLRDYWRTAPPPPRARVPEIPEALSALVMSLLSLEARGRPSSAAEVIERLNGIASLPADEEPSASSAYLTTPRLVGREELLLSVRKQVVQSFGGRGHVLFVDGAPGVGRSRFVDACVLEAKLLGISVLRADSSDGHRPYGAVSALVCQLIETYPNAAHHAAERLRPLLGHVVPSLLREGIDAPATEPARPALQEGLRTWFLGVARKRPLMLAVDDIDRIDEPSAALLATLAEQCMRHKLMLVVSAESGRASAAPAATAFLAAAGGRLRLRELESAQTRLLLGSVFGEIPNLDLLTDRLQSASGGNPRALMQLAQYLIDKGLVRFANGAFVLPDHLDVESLPRDDEAAIEARLSSLSPDALRVALLSSLAPEQRFELSELAELVDIPLSGRLFRALDELTTARVMASDALSTQFARAEWAPACRRTISAQDVSLAHERLASILIARGEQDSDIQAAAHLLAAGRRGEAFARIAAFAEASLQATLHNRPVAQFAARTSTPLLETLARGVDLARELGVSARGEHVIRAALVRGSCGRPSEMWKHIAPLLERLRVDAGLLDWAALDDALDASDRVSEALSRAQRRYDDTPEEERAFRPLEAIALLARVSLDLTSTAPVGSDLPLLELLPSLEPLRALSPALGIAHQVVEATKDLLSGRYARSARRYRKCLTRLEQPDRAGLDPFTHRRSQLGITYALGSIEASLGLPTAHAWADALDREPSHQVNAWLVRRLSFFSQGDAEQAEICRRKGELLRIQNAPEQWYEGTSLVTEMLAYANADDLMGIKRLLPSVHELAATYPGLCAFATFAEAEYARVRGDLEQAAVLHERGLEQAQVGRSAIWPRIAGQYVRVLSDLGRGEEAVERGRAFVAAAQEHEVYGSTLAPALALAEARAGDYQSACERVQAAIDDLVASGIRGLPLGLAHDVRARIALLMKDLRTFRHHSRECERHWNAGDNPALSALYARLIADARAQEIDCRSQFDDELTGEGETMLSTLLTMFGGCDGPTARAESVLSALIERSRAEEGFLFLFDGRALGLAAASGVQPPGLDEFVNESLARELEDAAADDDDEEDQDQGDHLDGDTSSVASVLCIEGGGIYRPHLLTVGRRGSLELVGVLVLRQADEEETPKVPYEVLRAAAQSLLDAGDVGVLSI